MTILLAYGLPYSGLGSIANGLTEQLGFHSLNALDPLRQERSIDSDLGKEINSYAANGIVVPARLIQQAYENYLSKLMDKPGVIIIGYPRTIEQAELLLEFTTRNNLNVSALFIQVPKEEILARLELSNHKHSPAESIQQELLNRIENKEIELAQIKPYLESKIKIGVVDGEGKIKEVVDRALEVLKI